MFKNNIVMPLPLEIASTGWKGMPESTWIRFGMKSNSVHRDSGTARGYVCDSARKVMFVMGRLLEVAAELLGDKSQPNSLMVAILGIDSLSSSERRENIEALGPDAALLKGFITDPLLDVLNSSRIDPLLLAPHLKAILRGPLGKACWGGEVTESQMVNAVTSNLMQMAVGLLRGPKFAKGVINLGVDGGRGR